MVGQLAALVILSLAISSFAQPDRSRLNLTYDEVRHLGNSCPSLDSCGHRRTAGSRNLDSSTERNCACDYLCDQFGDCCIDAPVYLDDVPDDVTNDWKCFELRQFGGVYMKNKCSPEYTDRDLLDLCENMDPMDYSDPLRDMPVTDSATGLTYRNYYCGMCNGQKEGLVFWTPRLECPTLTLYNSTRKNLTHEYVVQNLIYDGTNWGLYLDGDNGSLFFHDCIIDPVIPRLLESKIRLCRPQSFSKCASDWENDRVKTLCKAYTGLRYFHSESYKNIHCALCNHVNVSLLTCHPVEYREMFVFRTFEYYAFSLLLDINEQKGQEVGHVTKCDEDEVFDPFFKKCRQFRCLPGKMLVGLKCVSESTTVPSADPSLRNQTTVSYNTTEILVEYINETHHQINSTLHSNNDPNRFQNNSGITYNTSTLEGDDKLEKFKNCLLISLLADDYTVFDNKTIYVPEYDKWYEPTNYFSVDGSVLVCSHFDRSQVAKFTPAMGFVTVIGLGISMLCLFLHFVIFCIVPDLQNLSGKNLMSQCVALFFAYCFYIIGECKLGSTICIAVSYLTIYFFQASFFWMNSMAFDVWRTLKMATTELRVTSGKKWKRFVGYSLYSWLTPLMILGLISFAEYSDLFPELYRPHFAQPRCWFKHRRSLLCFFATPLFAVIVSNIILFTSSARMIIMTTKTTVKQQNSAQNRNFKLYLRLFVLMGLTWVVGLVAGYVDISALWYLFILLNTLQGLFIFVAFSCSTKVLNNLRDRYSRLTKSSEFRSSAVHSSSQFACNTNSTTVLTNVKPSKLWGVTKLTISPKNSSSSNFSRH